MNKIEADTILLFGTVQLCALFPGENREGIVATMNDAQNSDLSGPYRIKDQVVVHGECAYIWSAATLKAPANEGKPYEQCKPFRKGTYEARCGVCVATLLCCIEPDFIQVCPCGI